MLPFELSPYIRVAMDSKLGPPWSVGERHIWDYELLYLKEGRLRVTVQGTVYDGRAGDIFLFKPNQRHSINIADDSHVRQPHVHFDLIEQPDSVDVPISFVAKEVMSELEKSWFRTDLLSSPDLFFPNHIRLNHPDIFEKMLFELIAEYQIQLPFHESSMKALLTRMLVYIGRELHWSAKPYVQSYVHELLRVQEYLNQHTNREVTLDELTEQFNISKYYLSRLYKQTFDCSPIQYHHAMRMEKAKQMIRFTNLSLQHISDQLGFQSIHSFSRAFKNKEGVPPSYYRRFEANEHPLGND